MRIAFVCQAVDEGDPILAGTVSWLRTLAGRPDVEAVFVIALRTGAFELPGNVEVHAIGEGRRWYRLQRFYRAAALALKSRVDCFFVYQSGPYPVLLLPMSLLTGRPIFQWRAHPHVPLLEKVNILLCDSKVFTSTPAALPFASPKVRVVGQGVDTALFSPKPGVRNRDFVTVTRLSPSKRLDLMMHALAWHNRISGRRSTLDLYGPTPERDCAYRLTLERLGQDLGLSGCVFLRGPIKQADIPDTLSRYRIFLNFSDTALDRSVVEAMACGLPVLSTNPCVADILPRDLREELIMRPRDISAQGERMLEVLSRPEKDRLDLGLRLRKIVIQDHGIESLVDRILGEMTQGLR